MPLLVSHWGNLQNSSNSMVQKDGKFDESKRNKQIKNKINYLCKYKYLNKKGKNNIFTYCEQLDYLQLFTQCWHKNKCFIALLWNVKWWRRSISVNIWVQLYSLMVAGRNDLAVAACCTEQAAVWSWRNCSGSFLSLSCIVLETRPQHLHVIRVCFVFVYN